MKKIFCLSLIIISFLSIIFPLFQKTYADSGLNNLHANSSDIQHATYKWLDVMHIQATFKTDSGTINATFTDSGGMNHYWNSNPQSGGDKPTDNYRYQADDCMGGGMSTIWANPYYKVQGQPYFHAHINYYRARTVGNYCTGDGGDVAHLTIGDQSNSDVFYRFSGNNIEKVDGDQGWQFHSNGTYKDIFEKTNGSNSACPDIIFYNENVGDKMGNGTAWPLQPPGNIHDPWGPIPQNVDLHVGNCFVSKNVQILANNACGELSVSGPNFSVGCANVSVGKNNNGSTTIHIGGTPPSNPGVSGGAPTTGSSNNGSSTNTPSCEASGFSLAWAFCGVINAMQSLENPLWNFLSSILAAPIFNLGNNNHNNAHNQLAIYEVWSNIRTYGNVILVIAILIIVYAEAIGGSIADAYTVRKMLPRILVTAILINLSFYIVLIMFDVTNVLAKGIDTLLNSALPPNTNHINIGGSFGQGFGLLTFLTGAGALAYFGLGGFNALAQIGVLVVLPVIFAIVAVLVTVIIRQTLVVLLLVASPIAFAAYCLPNTESIFKKWWSLLIKTLMVYPIIAVLFAAANFAGALISGVQTSGDWSGPAAAIATVLPLFLVPWAFKMSGGVIGQVSGMAANIGKKAAQGIQGDKKDPNSLRNKLSRRAKLSRVEKGVTPSLLASRFTNREKYNDKRDFMAAKLAAPDLENNAIWQQNQNDSKFLDAVANPTEAMNKRNASSGADREAWDRAIANAGRMKAGHGARMAAFQRRCAMGYEFGKGVDGYNDMALNAAALTGCKLKTNADGSYQTDANGAYMADETDPNHNNWVKTMNAAQANIRQSGNHHLGTVTPDGSFDPLSQIDKLDAYKYATTSTADSIAAHSEFAIKASQRGDHAEVAKAKAVMRASYANAPAKSKAAIKKALDDLEAHSKADPAYSAWASKVLRSEKRKVEFKDQEGWSSEERLRGWRYENHDVTQEEEHSTVDMGDSPTPHPGAIIPPTTPTASPGSTPSPTGGGTTI